MLNWDAVSNHSERLRGTRITDLFEQNSDRAEAFSVQVGDLLFDYSKTLLDQQALFALKTLADEAELFQLRDEMFSGKRINISEDRAVLHTALRSRADSCVLLDGQNVVPLVHRTLQRMARFASGVRAGTIRAASGCSFTDVINIGIGGSDLGPAMACDALRPYSDGPAAHFLSNIDGAQATELLRRLNPESTLVIVVSKTFTTIETMTNAKTVRDWMVQKCGNEAPMNQFSAVSSAIERCVEFGLAKERVFGFGDWVGGRYSVWGPVGLALMTALGESRFHEFLAGAREIDENFQTASVSENLPLLHGLIGIWHNQICGYPTRAVLPYDHRLRRMPAYLQQLIMESNGKSVTRSGRAFEHPSSAVVWGEPGTNGQHAFYQALHQGNQIIPCEFLVAAVSHEPELQHHHDLLVANCIAQSEALMQGRQFKPDSGSGKSTKNDLAAHRSCPGNRPSTTLIYPRLTPFVLGQIIALYEHSVFVEGAVLGINSFDQWGVELGKEIAGQILPKIIRDNQPAAANPSTRLLLEFISAARRGSKSAI